MQIESTYSIYYLIKETYFVEIVKAYPVSWCGL